MVKWAPPRSPGNRAARTLALLAGITLAAIFRPEMTDLGTAAPRGRVLESAGSSRRGIISLSSEADHQSRFLESHEDQQESSVRRRRHRSSSLGMEDGQRSVSPGPSRRVASRSGSPVVRRGCHPRHSLQVGFISSPRRKA
jgi:hypothetical protein